VGFDIKGTIVEHDALCHQQSRNKCVKVHRLTSNGGAILDFLAGAALGLLIGGIIVLAWSVIGFAVAIFRYLFVPFPSAPPTGTRCDTCIKLQGLWLSMSWPEKAASLPNFVAAAVICSAIGCGGIALTW
jgi:hypothetical protein